MQASAKIIPGRTPDMLTRLIQWSLSNRGLVLGLSALALAFGVHFGLRLPVEVLPDLTKPTVVILTEAPGLAPEEVESRISQPIENALRGVGSLARLRSTSEVALSLVQAEFEWGVDVQRARTQVQERLLTVREQLPEGIQPFMAPAASMMGEILLIGVRSTLPKGHEGHLSPSEVRMLADWTIRQRLQSIPGIAEVLNMGGGVRRLEVLPDPEKLAAHGISLAALESAVARASGSSTGGFLTSGPAEVMVRALAHSIDPAEIGRTLVSNRDGRALTLADVATVTWGLEPMRGDASISIAPEKEPTYGVIMTIAKAPGFDTRALTGDVASALAALKPSLPAGVETVLLFQQKSFIDRAIGNLGDAIRDGAIMVAIVLFLFLLNIRTTVITLMAIPTSFAVTLITFQWFGITVNSMTLGGLAVAIGMVVDDAIVGVENVFRRLRENAGGPSAQPVPEVIAWASGEVRYSLFYATLIIALAFTPLLGLSGLEGRLFMPIAIATIVSMAASFVVSLTIIPVLCALLLNPKLGKTHTDTWFVSVLKRALRATFLRAALTRPAAVLLVVGVAVGASFLLYPTMNKEFLPKFREETALLAITAAPGTSLEEMNRLSDAVESQILSVRGIHQVGRRLGRAERGDHVVPLSTAEFDIDFDRDPSLNRDEIINEVLRRARSVPGIFAASSGPLADRIGHMLSGVSAPVAIKVFGPDLETLRQLGGEVQSLAREIPGFANAKLDQSATVPQLRIETNRDRAVVYGTTPGEINEQVSTWTGGKVLAVLRDGARSIDLVLRAPAAWREDRSRIEHLPIELEDGRRVPLSLVADVRDAKGPHLVTRENGQRVVTVAIRPTSGDVAGDIRLLQSAIAARLTVPPGCYLTYEGEFRAQEAASQRILLLSAIVLIVIVVLLANFFHSLWLALQVILTIPLSLAGGLVCTWLMLDNISIATLVGFIAVAGIAARNGIMMISHYLHLMRREGEGFTRSMVERGTLERMSPVLMTALAAGIALVPLLFAADEPGKEILHPVAVVIVGGLISSTLLEFLVRPLLFYHFSRRAAERSVLLESSASY